MRVNLGLLSIKVESGKLTRTLKRQIKKIRLAVDYLTGNNYAQIGYKHSYLKTAILFWKGMIKVRFNRNCYEGNHIWRQRRWEGSTSHDKCQRCGLERQVELTMEPLNPDVFTPDHVKEQRKKFKDEIEQPRVGGEPNPRFKELYPQQAEKNFSKDEKKWLDKQENKILSTHISKDA